MAASRTRVLIVDDSALVRRILADALASANDIEVVGAAPDPYAARDMIVELRPDVVTLDIEMPRMDGLTFLGKLMRHHPLPVIVISSLTQTSSRTAIRALEEGAVDALGKPAGPHSIGELRTILPERIRAAAHARVRGPAPARQVIAQRVSGIRSSAIIAIGASTGGTEAIRRVLEDLPPDLPPAVIAQHIPAGFSRAFSERLNQLCGMEIKEAEDGDALRQGRVLIAPGGFHMLIHRCGMGYKVSLNKGPRVCYQRPSVDVLFRSVAEHAQEHSIGVLLTGMGSDGARGLARIREAGGTTIAQDEATSIVFGMPREAIRIGAAAETLPLDQIASSILRKVVARDGIDEHYNILSIPIEGIILNPRLDVQRAAV